MATLDDLNDVLGSMRTSMVSQSNILSEMLKLQKRIETMLRGKKSAKKPTERFFLKKYQIQ